MLGRRGFEKGVPHLIFDVARDDRVIDFSRGGFVDIVELFLGFFEFELFDWQEPLDDNILLHDVLELVVDQVDGIDALFGSRVAIALDERTRDASRGVVGKIAKDVHELMADVVFAALEIVSGLLADDLHVECLRLDTAEKVLRPLHDVGVERSAEPLVGANDDDVDIRGLAFAEQRVGVRVRAGRQTVEHLDHLLGKGSRGEDGILRAPELGGGDHLHGFGDLLGVLDAPGTAFQIAKARHLVRSSKMRAAS